MTRKTVMHRETEVFVVDEMLAAIEKIEARKGYPD